MGQVGTKLEDRYHLQKVKLGQGSFGIVWRAVDKASQDVVAVKQLVKSGMAKRGASREDIEREVNIMSACRHVNLLGLLGVFEDDKNVYLALEYCDGGDFGDKVKERGQHLKEEEAVRWMYDIVSGICALHSKGICHRDVKPDNFMVQGGVGKQCIKLADFGLAVFLPHRQQLLMLKCGTPAFMSPEVHLLPGFSPGYSLPCDIWATGVTLSMLMHAGQHPFVTSSGQLDENALLSGSVASEGLFNGLIRQGPQFSDEANQLCKRMLEVSPNNRPSAEDTLRSPWFRARGMKQPQHAQTPVKASPRSSPVSQGWDSPVSAAALGNLVQAMLGVGVDSSPAAAATPAAATPVVRGSPRVGGHHKPPAMPSPQKGRGPCPSPQSSPAAKRTPSRTPNKEGQAPTPCRALAQRLHF